MKRAIWILLALMLLGILDASASAAEMKIEARTLINPFTVKLYKESGTNPDPLPLILPKSWMYPGGMRRLGAGGTRSITVGNKIIFIRQAPPRSTWRP